MFGYWKGTLSQVRMERNFPREALSDLDLIHAVCLTMFHGRASLKIAILHLWDKKELPGISSMFHPINEKKNQHEPIRTNSNQDSVRSNCVLAAASAGT